MSTPEEGPAKLAESLWPAMLALYEEPGVSDACIAAQDACGVDVLALLYATLLARHNIALSHEHAAQLEANTAPWRVAVIQPLRQLRRQWREVSSAATLRSRLQALELDAEREQVRQMARVLSQQTAPIAAGQADAALLARNVAQVCSAATASCEAQVSRLLEVLTRGVARPPVG